jgi:hypothetical protein
MICFTGNRVNDAGYTIWCTHPAPTCPCNENVEGHGRTVARAYEVACAKFGGSKIEMEASEEQPVGTEEAVASPITEPKPIGTPKKRGRPAKVKAVKSDEDLPL